MKINLSMNELIMIIIIKNLVYIQVHFLKIDLVHVKFTQYESVI